MIVYAHEQAFWDGVFQQAVGGLLLKGNLGEDYLEALIEEAEEIANQAVSKRRAACGDKRKGMKGGYQ